VATGGHIESCDGKPWLCQGEHNLNGLTFTFNYIHLHMKIANWQWENFNIQERERRTTIRDYFGIDIMQILITING